MLTDNQKKVIRYLIVTKDSFPSINKVAKDNNLSPNGALKILNKLKMEGILKIKEISNIKSYYIDFEQPLSKNILEWSLISKTNNKIQNRYNDLVPLKKFTDICILFGSYIQNKKTPNDIDILFVLDKKNFKKYKQTIKDTKNIIPIELHDMIQTKEDLIKNIQDKKEIILKIIQTGHILWGHTNLIEVLIDAYKR
jgi:hypothetical protein